MQKYADITFQDNVFYISGDLNFFNVMSLYQKSLRDLPKTSLIHFNFSKLNSSNSAGLALIIEWIKVAKEHHCPIQFSDFPQSLLSIAKAAGIMQLITII